MFTLSVFALNNFYSTQKERAKIIEKCSIAFALIDPGGSVSIIIF